MIKAAFLDRDGVINRKAPEGEYVTRWEEMEFLPGVADAIVLLAGAGFRIFVISNQRCVAKGLLTIQDLEVLHGRMRDFLASEGAKIDGIYYCPHDDQPPCSCRKPAPGMLLNAASDHQIDLHESWMIGDSASDVEAGKRAGCKTAQVLGPESRTAGADVVERSLGQAVQQILRLEESASGRRPETKLSSAHS
jgi:D-glycero-D-manno-heptose 1,7-bisphosphate phosphatase